MTSYTKQERRIRVLKYFIETPEKPDNKILAALMIAFLLLITKGLMQFDVVGALFILIGLAGLYIVLKRLYKNMKQYRKSFRLAEPKATDQEMDNWRNAGYRMVFDEAKRRLGIEEEDMTAESLKIAGPGNRSQIAPGKDRVLRFNHHNILLLFLTEHNIAAYGCILDLGSGEILEDSTKEFPFRDITNLETYMATGTFIYHSGSEKTQIKGVQTLSIYTSGNNFISVNYFFSRDVEEDYLMPPSDAENTIKAIRKRLTEYKNRYRN
jgi:predicted peroxiredoxin